MRKVKLCLLLLSAFLYSTADAQLHPPKFDDPNTPNFYKHYVGVQLTVTSPTSISGPVNYTVSNDGGTGDWGALPTTMIDKVLVKATPDSFACTPPTNDMTGKIALIWRGPIPTGSCEFGWKALEAQNKGAIACIIVNHSPGGPVGMGAGAVGAQVTIPVFMISMEDGAVISNRMVLGDTVKVSITIWGSGKTHDLAVLPNGIATSHAFAIPKSQMGTNNGNPQAYKGYDGAFLANFGSSNETGIKLNSLLTFTPEGSTTPQTVRADSVSFASFPVLDSIVAIGMNNSYDVHPTGASQKGRFDLKYTLKANAADEFLANNTASYSYYVTEDVFSKGRYNFAKNTPIANQFWRLGTAGADFMLGNLYYVAKPGWGAISSILSISKDATSILDGSTSTLLIYKWADTLFPDKLIQTGELELRATGSITYGPNDSTGKMYNVNYAPVNGTGINGLMLDSNSWYFVAAVTQGDCFLGMDGQLNHYPRTYLRNHAPINKYTEFYASQYLGSQFDLQIDSSTSPGLTFPMWCFERGPIDSNLAVDSARFAQQKNGFIPAISLRIAQTLGTGTIKMNDAEVNVYPNPSTTDVNISVNLKERADRLTYSILSIDGKLIKTEIHKNVTSDQLTISTKNMEQGNYIVIVNADNKSTTVKKFSVIKD
jgi:hypothetical protein